MGVDAPAVEKPAGDIGNAHACLAGRRVRSLLGNGVFRTEWGTIMAKDDQKNTYKKFILFLAGVFVLILGVTLILVWWKDVVALLKGAAGVLLALAGLFTLYALNK